jgi:L-fucose mutarotase
MPGDNAKTPIWDVYKKLVSEVDDRGDNAFIEVERFEFYERAKKAYAVIATGETAVYANIMLQKGVVIV